ncbi:hypothetical protein BDR07DRAFT_1410888 [Suillus spraguei]|nr:hypothetical protein BDR07DRAFT_1410888 [Suillus spraguei]
MLATADIIILGGMSQALHRSILPLLYFTDFWCTCLYWYWFERFVMSRIFEHDTSACQGTAVLPYALTSTYDGQLRPIRKFPQENFTSARKGTPVSSYFAISTYDGVGRTTGVQKFSFSNPTVCICRTTAVSGPFTAL